MIKLPKDAKGREIPFDTECLYTYKGEKQDVLSFMYHRREDIWEIETDMRTVNSIYLYLTPYLTPPDSWEKLEEDLLRASGRDTVISYCRYFTAGKCADCPIRNGASCCVIHKDERAFADILERIRKLRGEDK